MFNKLSIKYLNDLGYNPVSFPFRDFEPLDILHRDKKKLMRLGSVSHIIADTAGEEPETKKDQETPNISGNLSADFDFKLGITAMNDLLSAIGASGAGIDVAFKRVKQFTFQYNNILRDSVDPFEIADYLGSSAPDMNYTLLDHLDEKKEAYIVQEVLKSNSFSTTTTDEKGTSIDIDVANIQQILSVHPSISVNKTGEFTVSFEGEKYFNFAVMVMMVWGFTRREILYVQVVRKAAESGCEIGHPPGNHAGSSGASYPPAGRADDHHRIEM
jgi:hypothetical protein